MSARNVIPNARIGLLVLACFLVGSSWAGDVRNSPHNLSTSGPGSMKSVSESEICIFCHAPHSASPQAPLWNRRDPGGTYTTYTSSTMQVPTGQPSGASRLCLSCHDGTIAPGSVLSRGGEIAMAGGRLFPHGRARVGIDLSDDHPVSFPYAASLAQLGIELRPSPSVSGLSLLDSRGLVQCTSCHDPHDNAHGSFLRTEPRGGALCLLCHALPGWDQSSHAASARTWNGAGPDPWPHSGFTTVAENACGGCHTPHEAGGRKRLLVTEVEEDVCLVCHSGAVAGLDISAELTKWTSHSVSLAVGVHDPTEAPDGRATHVECVDCHDPHRTNDVPAVGGGLPGSLQGVAGLSSGGSPVQTITHEYELCLKCHADGSASNPDRIPRISDQPNIRLLFDVGNSSFHPVTAPGKNPDVPSLKPPYTTSSVIRCTDCHNNDAGSQTGGIGPRGPHGSRWDFLLERRYDTTDPNPESAAAYSLCYKCHERASILSDESFKGHRKHVQREGAACSVCHDPHGVDPLQASAGSSTHLINFDARWVSPNRDGKLEFRDLGRFRGSCSLRCHEKDHRGKHYMRR